MDGFGGDTGVIVIAATNRAEVLDSALTRPGRFDRVIEVELPDVGERREILAVHLRDKPLADDVEVGQIARNTYGFSGADLSNLANEAAIHAARRGGEQISHADFDDAYDKITMGLVRDRQSKEEDGGKRTSKVEASRRIVAYHEAGHALVAIERGYRVKKASIVARGKAGGVTVFDLDEDQDGLVAKEELRDQIAIALGGRLSESLVFGPGGVTTGASSDIQSVQRIARDMLVKYGMSDVLGPIAWDGHETSGATSAFVDEQILELVEEIREATAQLLEDGRGKLDAIAELLLEQETATGQEILDVVSRVAPPSMTAIDEDEDEDEERRSRI
jgi:cell division protease FtsH